MMIETIDFTEFHDLLLNESRTAFRLAQEAHPNETFYAFGFNYRPWDLMIPAANTVEGHMRLGQLTEAERDNQTLDWFYTRWESMYWVYYDQKQFDRVNAWLYDHRIPLPGQKDPQRIENWAIFDSTCERICLNVLQTLDDEKCFGDGQAREKVIVNLMSPMKREGYLDYAYKLNAFPTYLQWRLEMELHILARRVLPHTRFERKRK